MEKKTSMSARTSGSSCPRAQGAGLSRRAKAGVNMKVCCSALLVLCLAFRVGEARESFPMQSLRCYNDYTSQITCTWQECTATRRFLNLTLYHEDSLFEEKTQMPCELQRAKEQPMCPDSCVFWRCRKNSTNFAYAVKDIYTFKPDQDLQAKLTVSLFQNVRPLPPQELWIYVTEAGDFLLAWKAVVGRKESERLHDVLEFEVTYKREWESWEKSSSVAISNSSHCLLKRDALVPGSTYVARVRSKPSQGSGWFGQPSEWSKAVTWRFQEGDEAQPKNLHCFFNGIDRLTCSWEVRREVTSSALFTLFYRVTAASNETECSPVQEVELHHSLYILQSCEINVTDPSELSQYFITVRPKKEEKLIQAYKNIKPHAPINVTMTKVKDEKYELRWIKQNLSYEFIAQRYEFWYWKTGDTLETGKHVNISNDKPPFIFTLQMLKPSTHYTGKMRAKVQTPTLSYEGPWSEWSEECTWETESAVSVWSPLKIQLMVPIFTILLIAFAWCGYKGLLSKKKKWEEKIPNPGKSHLLQSYLQKVPLGMLWPGSQLDFGKLSPSEKMDLTSCFQELDRHTKVSSSELSGAEAEKMVCFFGELDSKNLYQTLEITPSAPRPSALASCQLSHGTSQALSPATLASRSSANITASQTPISCFDFNGPYLHLPQTCSLPDIHRDWKAARVGTRGRLLSVEYVSLPQEAHSQALLVQTEKERAHLHPISPSQKEMKQLLAGGQVPQDQPRVGDVVPGDTEGQRSPTATINNSCQKWPSGYVTTEGLSLVPAGESAHLSPALALPEGMVSAPGVLISNPRWPHTTEGTPNPELGPKKPGVIAPVLCPASAASSGVPLPVFGYIMFPENPNIPQEPIDVSSPILAEEVEVAKAESVQESNVVMFNPDGTGPVFLQQVGEYCFLPGLKSGEKPTVNESSPLTDHTSEAKEAFGKPPCDGGSVNGKQEPALHMQAIQLFKTLKHGDYFTLPLLEGQEPSIRVEEVC